MFTHYRTQGLVLKNENRGENDQILTILTEDFGKLEILGKAIRKIKSKLRSSANPFSLAEIEFIQGKVFKTLTDAVILDNFQELKKDLKKLKTSYQISEALDKLVQREEKDEKIWDLSGKTFEILNKHSLSIKNYPLLYYYFLWNLFNILGYSPELYKCVICRKKIVQGIDIFFSAEEGGLICGDECQERAKFPEKTCSDAIKILRIIFKKDFADLAKIKINESHLRSLKEISDNYLRNILSK